MISSGYIPGKEAWAWASPGCAAATTSGSPCPTWSRRTRSWSTCWAASTSTRCPDAPRRRLDARPPQRRPARGGARDPLLPLRLRPQLRGLRVRAARPDQRARRATATSAATTSRSTSTTSTRRSRTCARKGVRLLAGPIASRNASAGQRWLYFLSPWGMQFELVSYPGGKAYERDAAGASCGTRATRAERLDRRSTIPATARASPSAPDRGQPARRDPGRQLPAGRADQAGGRRGALRGEPHPGARGAADARGRGPRHPGRQLGRLGDQADPGRVRRDSTRSGSGSSRCCCAPPAGAGPRRDRPAGRARRRRWSTAANVDAFLRADREFHLSSYAGAAATETWQSSTGCGTPPSTTGASSPGGRRRRPERHPPGAPAAARLHPPAGRRRRRAGARDAHPPHPAGTGEASGDLRLTMAGTVRLADRGLEGGRG